MFTLRFVKVSLKFYCIVLYCIVYNYKTARTCCTQIFSS